MASGAISDLSQHLKLSAKQSEQLAGVRSAALVRYDLPMTKAGLGSASRERADMDDDDFRQGTLRVSVLQAEGLPLRADGGECAPYVTVSVAELTRRRVRKTTTPVCGVDVMWGEAFDFALTSACAQVVVDVWDRADQNAPADLLGKTVVSVSGCRPGIPHTIFSHLLHGKLAVRLLFDFEDLPDIAAEEAQIQRLIGL
uniref:C2 domain-containing protein n=1 Tax=Coccolithus braarudii TaxID=221442 RepID=A0A7S0Q0P8_9EUKA